MLFILDGSTLRKYEGIFFIKFNFFNATDLNKFPKQIKSPILLYTFTPIYELSSIIRTAYTAGNKKGLSRSVPVCATEFVHERSVDCGSGDLTLGTPLIHDNILAIVIFSVFFPLL